MVNFLFPYQIRVVGLALCTSQLSNIIGIMCLYKFILINGSAYTDKRRDDSVINRNINSVYRVCVRYRVMYENDE